MLRHPSRGIPFAVMLCTIALAVEATAFEQGDYTTPDTWSRQVSPGQMQESVTGIGLGGTKVYTTLTSRYRLRFNDIGSNHLGNDQDFYQYLRVRTDSVKLGNGAVTLSTYARFAADVNGDKGKYEGSRNGDLYYYYRDTLDAQLKHDEWAPRFYVGTATFDGVVKNTKATVGRLTLGHLNDFMLDGGDVGVKLGDKATAYVYGGKPVSFYYHTGQDVILGGGATYQLAPRTRFAGEYTRLSTKGVDTDYGKMRIDQSFANGSASLGSTVMDGAVGLTGEIGYEVVATGTILTAKYHGMLNDVGTASYVVNPLTDVVGVESRYNKYELGAHQAFLDHFVLGIRFQERIVTGPENFGNRSYERIGGTFDISGLPHKDTYISFSADYWGVRRTPTSNSNDSIQYGVQIGQKLTKAVDIWAGTSYNRYDYDQNLNLSLNPDYSTGYNYYAKRMDWARNYYVGAQYRPTKTISLSADVNLEHGSFYSDINNGLNTNYTTELWANIIF